MYEVDAVVTFIDDERMTEFTKVTEALENLATECGIESVSAGSFMGDAGLLQRDMQFETADLQKANEFEKRFKELYMNETSHPDNGVSIREMDADELEDR